MPDLISAADVPTLLRPGMTVYAPGLGGESPLLVEALKAAPEASAGVHYIGVWLPGINRVDYAGLHPTASSTAFFISPDFRSSFEAGRMRFLPLSYLSTYAYLREAAEIDLDLLHVSPPDMDGRCSLGIANDFSPAVIDKARVRVAHINPRMPHTVGAGTITYDALDAVIEAEGPLLTLTTGHDPVMDAIGGHLATIVGDGDTLEIGVGHIQGALAALKHKRGLRIHSGAITDSVLPLIEAGAIAAEAGAMRVGVAIGTPALYDFVADNPQVHFTPVGTTHDIATLRAIPQFVAINAVIEVDLLGQANAEMVGGRQISSAGGITDFMRGARLSPGGRAIVALPSTAKRGTVSRIVPALPEGSAVSVARADMELVVTEHGVADLRGKDIDTRAEALIAVAAPALRDELAASWRARRRTL